MKSTNNWWKDPRLDDEGTYDYLIEELPEDRGYWSHFPHRCSYCGKTRRLSFNYVQYFYCWDGWDSMEDSVCWVCMLKDSINHFTHAITRPFRCIKFYVNAVKNAYNITKYTVTEDHLDGSKWERYKTKMRCLKQLLDIELRSVVR